ncbi:hypothetical protein BT69DRAFT_1225310 [Atractiella rhizophila]|nr:hypothetical protein BT69DRAFT_1225310 [Atractiella rhizophila]
MPAFDYGDFDYICRKIPSYPICNLFYRQLLNHPHNIAAPAFQILALPDPAVNRTGFDRAVGDAGVGIRPECAIPRMGSAGGDPNSNGNVANIVLCAVSTIVALGLAVLAGRRMAAVARLEILLLFVIYALTCIFQLVDTGAFLRQGSTALVWVSGIHQGLVVGFFWSLAWIAFLQFQVVEDGTLSSIVPYTLGLVVLTVGTSYIALDVGFTVTNFFQSKPAEDLTSAWLFTLLIVFPLVCVAFYFIVTAGVVVKVLREKKPLIILIITLALFALSQGAYWALSHTICTGTSAKVDGSFLATLLETTAVVALFAGWKSITEEAWVRLYFL